METFVSHVEVIAIKLGRIWQWMEEGIPYGIVSACRNETFDQNDTNTQRLRDRLIRQGYNPIWVLGGIIETPMENGMPIYEADKEGKFIQETDPDGNPVYKIKRISFREDSWLVRDIDLEAICRFGQQFKQESVVFYGGKEGPFGTFFCNAQNFMQQEMSFLADPPNKPQPDILQVEDFAELQKGNKRRIKKPSGRKISYITPEESVSSSFKSTKILERVWDVQDNIHSFSSAMRQYHTEGRITSNLVTALSAKWIEYRKL